MFSILFKRIYRLSVLFSIFVFFALNFSTNVSEAREKIVEMLVSNTGMESGSGVVRYNAGTGEFMGSLDDPNEDFIKLPYDRKRRYDQPKGLAVDSDGQIYVAYRCSSCDNPQKGAILKFSMKEDGRFLTQPFAFGPGTKEGFEGLARSPDNKYLFASQRENGYIYPYEIKSGDRLYRPPDFLLPRGLTFDGSGKLYILTQSDKFVGAGQIIGITAGGKPFPFVEPEPNGPLQLDDSSADLTFGPMGDLFVVSTGRDKILRYRIEKRSLLPKAKFLDEFAVPVKNGCKDPVGLAFGPHDQNLYVTCRTSNNIVRYDGITGRFIDEFVRGGRFSKLHNPTYITFTSYDLPSPIRLKKPYNNEETDPVTVFQWQPSEKPEVHSYQLIIAKDSKMEEIVDLDNKNLVESTQVALNLSELGLDPLEPFYWRIIALDHNLNPIEREQSQIFLFISRLDPSEYTMINGLVKSDLTHSELVAANVDVAVNVAISTERHAQTENRTMETYFNEEYIIIALTRDKYGNTIRFPIEITCTGTGFLPITVNLEDSESHDRMIIRDLMMIADFDGDGISNATENDSCLDANDADTDDDGIADGDEDTNKDGVTSSEETDPCDADTDNDGIQDGTELGLTLNDIGPDTDTAKFQPDIDPSTRSNPRDDDSDKDGFPDGEEDLNKNGRVDSGETEPGFLNARALPAILPLLIGD